MVSGLTGGGLSAHLSWGSAAGATDSSFVMVVALELTGECVSD